MILGNVSLGSGYTVHVRYGYSGAIHEGAPVKVSGVSVGRVSAVDFLGGGGRDAAGPISVVGASRVGGQAIEAGFVLLFVLLFAGFNIFVGVFNLFPLLPLDGGRVLVGMLPLPAARAFARTEPYGFLILLLLLYTDTVDAVINPIINAIARFLL